VTAGSPLSLLRALRPGPLAPGDEYRRPATRANSHVHLPPNFSAFASATEATELAAAQGVRVLGTSNYYDYSVYTSFSEQACRRGVFPLFGMEVICLDEDLQQASMRVNDPANPGKMYLCGKGVSGFAPMSGTASDLMGLLRRSDSARSAALIERLEAVFSAAGAALGMTEASVKALVARRYGAPIETVYLQERHVALACQEAVFNLVPVQERSHLLTSVLGVEVKPDAPAVQVQDFIRAQLMKRGRPAYVGETFPSFDHVYRLVLALGGIPCYPVLADGATPVCEFEQDVEGLVASLQERGTHCAELIPNRNEPEVLREYVTALRGAGMPVLAGTEHNTLEMIPIEPQCARGAPVPEDLREVFWEGICVVAAHQYLMARGEEGYVDANGELTGGYPGAEARLEAFARLGASVIDEYLKLATPARWAVQGAQE